MNHYLVQLIMIHEGYHTLLNLLTSAVNKEQAIQNAYQDIIRGSEEDGSATIDGDGLSDLYGDLHYHVQKVTKIEPSHLVILKVYLS